MTVSAAGTSKTRAPGNDIALCPEALAEIRFRPWWTAFQSKAGQPHFTALEGCQHATVVPTRGSSPRGSLRSASTRFAGRREQVADDRSTGRVRLDDPPPMTST